jgi:hypothetical protein
MSPDFGPLSGPAHRRPGIGRARRSAKHGIRAARRSPTVSGIASIRSDLPAVLPVTKQEVAVLVQFAADLLDALMAPAPRIPVEDAHVENPVEAP